MTSAAHGSSHHGDTGADQSAAHGTSDAITQPRKLSARCVFNSSTMKTPK